MPKRPSRETEAREGLIRHFDSAKREGLVLTADMIEVKIMAVVEEWGLSITNYHRIKGYLEEKYLKARS